jgi:hypothetical protein
MEIKINYVIGEAPADQPAKNRPEPAAVYRCLINVRENHRGSHAREAVLFLNGFEVTLQCDGQIYDHEGYPEESLFIPYTDRDKQLFLAHGLKYLAEGDVVILERVQADQLPSNMSSREAEAKKRRNGPQH